MKRIGLIFGVIALAILLVLPATASNIRKEVGETRYDLAVQNLINGVTSSNDGLRVSAIYQLGELEARDAVIPLMRVLRSGQDESSRIAAAWALCKIGESRGVFAVKQAVRFDDSKRVQVHCAWYYNLYVSDGTFAFIPSPTLPTEVAEIQ